MSSTEPAARGNQVVTSYPPWQLTASLPLQIDGWGRWIFLCFSAAFAASFGEATNVPFLLPGGCSQSHSTARRYWRCVQFSYLGCWCDWWMLTWLIACSTRVLVRMWIHLAPFPCFDMFFFWLSWSFQDVFSLLGDDQKFICIFHIGKPGAVLQSFHVSAALSSLMISTTLKALKMMMTFVWSRDFLVGCGTKDFIQIYGFHLVGGTCGKCHTKIYEILMKWCWQAWYDNIWYDYLIFLLMATRRDATWDALQIPAMPRLSAHFCYIMRLQMSLVEVVQEPIGISGPFAWQW